MSRESALSQIESQIAPPAAPVEEALAQTGIITESTPQPGPDAASTPPAALVTEDAPLGESEEEEGLNSTRIAAFRKREAKLQADQRAWDAKLKAEREAFEKEKQAWKEKVTPFEEFEILRSKDPIEAMKRLGFTDTDIFNFAAAHEKKEKTPAELAEEAAKKEVESFEKRQLEAAEKAQQERNDLAVSQFKTGLADLLEANKEELEYCAFKGKGALLLAWEEVEKHFSATTEKDAAGNITKMGEVLTQEEALRRVEKQYEEEDKAMSNLKKRKSALESPTSDTAEAQKEAPKAEVVPKPTKTLTNNATATTGAAVKRRETPEQKRERLENALRTGQYTPPK